MSASLLDLHRLLTLAVHSIAFDPERASIGFRTEPRLCFCIRVTADDLARIVGNQGMTLRALQMLVQAAGQKSGLDVRICVSKGEDA
jgi:predicted RNA-binding protein YlqC (UPF0109 family)